MSSYLCKSSMQFNPGFTLRALLLGGTAGGGLGLLSNLLRQSQAVVEEEPEDEEELPALVQKSAGMLETLVDSTSGLFRGINDFANRFNKAEPGQPAPAADPGGQPLSPLDYGLAATGIPLAALGAWHGTRGLFQHFRKQELQERLRNRRQALEQALLREAQVKEKQASGERQSPGALDLATMLILGSAGLSTLTAGMLTHRALDAQFPKTEKPKGSGFRPPRVLTEDDAEEKTAHAVEHLFHTVLATQHPDATDLANLVKAASCGALDDLAEKLARHDVDSALDLAAKYADKSIEDPVLKYAAVRDLANSPLCPLAEKLAACVFKNIAPSLCNEGAEIRQFPKLERKLEKLASAMVQAGLLSEVDPALRSSLMNDSTAAEHSSDGKQRSADALTDTDAVKDEVDAVLTE